MKTTRLLTSTEAGKRMTILTSVLLVTLLSAASAGTYCAKKPGERCKYQPTPACTGSGENPWVCTKNCTDDGTYGFYNCVPYGGTEEQCEDGLTQVLVNRYLGRCSQLPGGNCITTDPELGYWYSYISYDSFSQDTSPCGS